MAVDDLKALSEKILACEAERTAALDDYNDARGTSIDIQERYWRSNSEHARALQNFHDAWRRSVGLSVPERVPMRAKTLSLVGK